MLLVFLDSCLLSRTRAGRAGPFRSLPKSAGVLLCGLCAFARATRRVAAVDADLPLGTTSLQQSSQLIVSSRLEPVRRSRRSQQESAVGLSQRSQSLQRTPDLPGRRPSRPATE